MSADELREPTLLLLTALTAGPRHGYALLESVTELSGGRVRLKPGSLYGALDRLTGEGLVREVGTDVVAGRHRRYYELTDAGADTLTTQVKRLESLAAAATAGLQRRRSRDGVGLPAPADLRWAGGRA